ncbi:MAG: anaerobic ribonucleoside-triphosphate reductase activating protein [Alphaproteobacteria bacterium]|nr:anaerobic ribonucleoside-triphosphate reductase activating protein [Alphaproteobacteria bacterium]
MRSIFENIAAFDSISLNDLTNDICAVIYISGCNYNCPTCHNYQLRDGTILPKKMLHFNTLSREILNGVSLSENITITGGEPTIYEDLPEFIKSIRDIGFDGKIKLDTNGSNYPMVRLLIDEGLIQYISIDIKATFEKYSTCIGISHDKFVSQYKESLQSLLDYSSISPIPFEWRTTMVPSINKSDIRHIEETLLPPGIKTKIQQYRSP